MAARSIYSAHQWRFHMDDIFKRGIDPTDAFSAVCKSGGKFSVGLWRRRMDEVDIYLHGEYQREERIYGVG